VLEQVRFHDERDGRDGPPHRAGRARGLTQLELSSSVGISYYTLALRIDLIAVA